jgi:hypothetical protein
MPIINYICVPDGKEAQDWKKEAEEHMDKVVRLNFYINGKLIPINLSDFRVQTPAFDIYLPDNNSFGIPEGNSLIIVDGFWIFFQPLVNNFSVETLGACRSGKTQITIKYDVELV